jgi:hypothetical protein
MARALSLALLALAALPAAASARELQPPVPGGERGAGAMRDTVLRSAPLATTARAKAYKAPDGSTILVDVSPSYRRDDAAIQKFVDFLGRLPHGSELSRLRLYIATPGEVERLCGGVPGTLACYAAALQVMIAPGQQPPSTNLSLGYIVAHEYGHHVAANRTNAPFPASNYGPKYWASQELVCQGVLDKRYFPGDEGEHYKSNPGEAWAETYARLTYPGVAWAFDPSLAPDAASLATARRDVLDPWRGNVTKRFSGTLGARDKAKDVSFRLRLDGSLSLSLSGPRTANFDLGVIAAGREQATTRARGSRDKLSPRVVCRKSLSGGQITVRVRRRSGSGRFTVTAKYPG